ncbi:CIA30 family protein [Chitinimonas sp.]|uniref:CIA30 family protein n=1 Tax=Chitinimonas sp. TaxID=1934313 RepID=UPI0035AEC759
MLRSTLLASLLALLPLVPLYAETTLIREVAVFDGAERLAPRNVLLLDGKIADADFKGATPAGAREVRCAGCTLLPGLIDSHVHAFKDQELPLLFGVTSQLDMFMAWEQARPLKAKMARGENHDRPDLFTAGTLVTAPGGHGTEYGIPIPTLSKPEAADAFVAERVAEGSDYIKLVYDGGRGWGGQIPTLDLPTLKAAIAAAHRYRKLVLVHVQDSQAAREALEAGADGLVHLFTDKPADAELVALAKRNGAFVVPTYTVFEGFAGRPGGATLLADTRWAGLLDQGQTAGLQRKMGKLDLSARVDRAMHDSITALAAAGVPILAGTDAGNPATLAGVSLHRELELLVQAGLTPTQALAAATSVPARVFHLDDRGRIAKGLKADLLLVQGDPTVDIRASRALVEVWKDGIATTPLREARRQQIAAQRVDDQGRQALALPADGRISLFSRKDGQDRLAAPFGSWAPTTDALAKGNSTVSLKLAESDAQVLLLDGEIKPGFPFPWAGVSFNPGAAPMAPSNLSAASGLRFRVRGDGGRYVLQAFWRDGGFMPAQFEFEAGKDWQEVSIAFKQLTGFDPKQVLAFNFAAGGKPRAFHFELGDVRLLSGQGN